jgi:hypothetical protein
MLVAMSVSVDVSSSIEVSGASWSSLDVLALLYLAVSCQCEKKDSPFGRCVP